jgi:hypothetical protein
MIIPNKHKWSRWLLGFFAVSLMAMLYIFQRKLLWFQEITQINQIQYLPFILNRLMRLVLNDSLCLVLFLAIFNGTKEIKLASLLFVIELIIVLPLLMIILLVGLLYQKYRTINH